MKYVFCVWHKHCMQDRKAFFQDMHLDGAAMAVHVSQQPAIPVALVNSITHHSSNL